MTAGEGGNKKHSAYVNFVVHPFVCPSTRPSVCQFACLHYSKRTLSCFQPLSGLMIATLNKFRCSVHLSFLCFRLTLCILLALNYIKVQSGIDPYVQLSSISSKNVTIDPQFPLPVVKGRQVTIDPQHPLLVVKGRKVTIDPQYPLLVVKGRQVTIDPQYPLLVVKGRKVTIDPQYPLPVVKSRLVTIDPQYPLPVVKGDNIVVVLRMRQQQP